MPEPQLKELLATDDAALLEWSGKTVKVVVGSPRNFKLTTPDDFWLAEAILAVEISTEKIKPDAML